MRYVCVACGAAYEHNARFCPTDGSQLQPLATDDVVGQVIDQRYYVLERLGEGGMGCVYRAQHLNLPREVSLKLLSPALMASGDWRRRFWAEAEQLVQISHPHVAQIYDFGETADGLPYFTMEYVRGDTLKTLLGNEGALEPWRAARLVKQLADALDAVHARGIVHRDLKPANVIVSRSPDGDEIVKLIDFGIARSVTGAGLTKTGFILGTPEYMSPEQIMGSGVDRRTDVFSLGLMTVAMLTGSLPVSGTTPEQIMTGRLTAAPLVLRDIRADVAWPNELQSVVDAALAREPSARHQSAGAFADAFVAAVTQWVAPRSAARRAPSVRASTRVLLATATCLAVALGVAIAMLVSRRPSVSVAPSPPVAIADTHVVAPSTPAPSALPVVANGHRALVKPAPSPTPDSSRATPVAVVQEGRPRVDVTAQLDDIERMLDPDRVTESSARVALSSLDQVSPNLDTRDDSVRVGLLRFQALLHSNQVAKGCTVLRATRAIAQRVEQRSAADLWLENFCG